MEGMITIVKTCRMVVRWRREFNFEIIATIIHGNGTCNYSKDINLDIVITMGHWLLPSFWASHWHRGLNESDRSPHISDITTHDWENTNELEECELSLMNKEWRSKNPSLLLDSLTLILIDTSSVYHETLYLRLFFLGLSLSDGKTLTTQIADFPIMCSCWDSIKPLWDDVCNVDVWYGYAQTP